MVSNGGFVLALLSIEALDFAGETVGADVVFSDEFVSSFNILTDSNTSAQI